jgi:hypothetical protein
VISITSLAAGSIKPVWRRWSRAASRACELALGVCQATANARLFDLLAPRLAASGPGGDPAVGGPASGGVAEPGAHGPVGEQGDEVVEVRAPDELVDALGELVLERFEGDRRELGGERARHLFKPLGRFESELLHHAPPLSEPSASREARERRPGIRTRAERGAGVHRKA